MVSYITAGDPDIETTAEAMKILDECGVNIIELGVPYSDPLADGPVIQVKSFPTSMNCGMWASRNHDSWEAINLNNKSLWFIIDCIP